MQAAELEHLRTWLLNSTGLQAELLGRQRLERAVGQRLMEHQGETLPEYQRRFLGDPAEQQQLIEALVVGESWFLREPRSFEQLVALARRQRQRPLRLLSCGCSGGEEPFSLVIALLEAGIPAQQLAVEAIDISAVALARAADGLYGAHSLRGMDPRRLERFFDPEGSRWRLRPEIRAAVRFRRGTLQQRLRELPPGWHAVFCRNVMLYLHDQARRDLLMAIAERLAPDGLLVVAAAEAALVPADRYRRLIGGHGAGFTLSEADASAREAMATGGGQVGGNAGLLPSTADRASVRRTMHPGAAAGSGVSVGSPGAPEASARQQLLEPQTHLREARRLRLLRLPDEALAALRRCLYLDPTHREALTLRAELMGELGRHQEAEQLRRRLARASGGRIP